MCYIVGSDKTNIQFLIKPINALKSIMLVINLKGEYEIKQLNKQLGD